MSEQTYSYNIILTT